MTLQKERIIDVLKQVVPDEDAERILFYLEGKSNISEFIIAEELDLEIHRTRNLLYKLLDVNLVSFKRKKDKIKGWYICYWDFNNTVVSHLEEKLRLETIDKLKNRLLTEADGFFYMCRFAHTRQGFEESFENNFKCPECGELMNQVDNSRTIDFLKTRIADLEKTQEAFEEEKQKALAIVKKESLRIEAEEAKTKRKKVVKEKPKRNLLVKLPKKEVAKEESSKKLSSTKKTSAKKFAVKKKSKPAAKKAPAKKKSVKKTATSIKKTSTKKQTKKATLTKKKSSKKVVKKSSSTKKTSIKKTTKKAPVKKTTKKTLAKKIGGLFRK